MALFVVLVVAIAIWLCYRQYQRWEQYREDLGVVEALKMEIGNQLSDLLRTNKTIDYLAIHTLCTLMNLTREAHVRNYLTKEHCVIVIELRKARISISVDLVTITGTEGYKRVRDFRGS